jgi:type IV pilus assembly protein PilX
MNRHHTADLHRQHGAALIVALLILLVLTVLGVTSLQTSSLDEKMAGNSWDQNTAFQSAEAALRDAEARIDTLTSTVDFKGNGTSTNGLYATGGVPSNVFASSFWTGSYKLCDANSCGYGAIIGSLDLSQLDSTVQPRYLIESRGTVSQNTIADPMNSGLGYGETTGVGVVNTFRVISRGVGRNAAGSTQVILEEYYGKTF